MFSKACEYGLKAVLYIATQSLKDKRVKMGGIAKNIDSPEAFTAKTLGILVKNDIVDSLKGPSGGFAIDKNKMKSIKLSQIVFALDGDSIYNGCALGLKNCESTNPC